MFRGWAKQRQTAPNLHRAERSLAVVIKASPKGRWSSYWYTARTNRPRRFAPTSPRLHSDRFATYDWGEIERASCGAQPRRGLCVAFLLPRTDRQNTQPFACAASGLQAREVVTGVFCCSEEVIWVSPTIEDAPLMTVDEARSFFPRRPDGRLITGERVRQLCAAQMLPSIRLGKRILIPRRGLEEMIDRAITETTGAQAG